MVTEARGCAVIQKHLFPVVAQVAGNCCGDLPGIRRIWIGAVEDSCRWHGGNPFHEGRRVHRCRRVVRALPSMGQEHGPAPVEHPFDEHPFPGQGRALTMYLGRPDHRHGMAAAQEGVLCSHLVGAIAFPGLVVPGSRPHGRIVLEDRRIKAGRYLGIDVIAGGVNVHSLAREHDGRGHRGQVRQELPGVGLGVAHRVHEEIGTTGHHPGQCGVVTTFGGDKSGTGGSQVSRHLGPVPARHVHGPAGTDQPPRNRAAENASASKDHRRRRCRDQEASGISTPWRAREPRRPCGEAGRRAGHRA
ncbi:hypothetical protein SRABI128_06058 [Microbacterium sp. Bi128]|nr:hypothetical protein SRABI128_06058 [Microbacterium sp. Bi128]